MESDYISFLSLFNVTKVYEMDLACMFYAATRYHIFKNRNANVKQRRARNTTGIVISFIVSSRCTKPLLLAGDYSRHDYYRQARFYILLLTQCPH